MAQITDPKVLFRRTCVFMFLILIVLFFLFRKNYAWRIAIIVAGVACLVYLVVYLVRLRKGQGMPTAKIVLWGDVVAGVALILAGIISLSSGNKQGYVSIGTGALILALGGMLSIPKFSKSNK